MDIWHIVLTVYLVGFWISGVIVYHFCRLIEDFGISKSLDFGLAVGFFWPLVFPWVFRNFKEIIT